MEEKSDNVLNPITEDMRRHCLDHSTERRLSKDFPEYYKFLTGRVEQRKAKIINVNPVQTIDVIEEIKEGGLGDIIETYMNLVLEEKAFNSFWGQIKTHVFGYKRYRPDRQYFIEDLKKALNMISLKW
jgi:hypothetical protein